MKILKAAALMALLLLPACPYPEEPGVWFTFIKGQDAMVSNSGGDRIQLKCEKNSPWRMTIAVRGNGYEPGTRHTLQIADARRPDAGTLAIFQANGCGFLWTESSDSLIFMLRDTSTLRLTHTETGHSYEFPMEKFEEAFQTLQRHCGGPAGL